MATLFSAYLGSSGLTDVGYTFYDSSEAAIGSRATGVTDASAGWYVVSATAPSTAISVRWDSTGTPTAIAREYFNGNPIATNITQVSGQTASAAAGVTFPASIGTSTVTTANVQAELVTYGALKPTVASRTLDVNAAGEAGVDWANVGSQASTVSLTNTTIAAVASGGSGAYAVTVTVKTSGAVAIQNAMVRLASGSSAFTATTNAGGVASFSLNAATYTRSITASGYSFTPDTIVVSASANFNTTMTTVSIPTPTSPSLCAVYGTLVDANGVGVVGATLSIQLFKANSDTNGNSVISTAYSVVSGVAGAISINLVRNDCMTHPNSEYRVTYAPMNWQSKRMVLASASFNLATL